MRTKILIALSVLILLGAIAIFREQVSTPPPPGTSIQPNAPVSAPRIKITVNSSVYSHGYLHLVGVAENTGTKPAFSPAIEVRVFDVGGKTLLGRDRTYPVGTMLKNFDPQASAAFESITRVPGEPDKIKYEVEVPNFAGTVEFKK